jgi:TolA-binding protein
MSKESRDAYIQKMQEKLREWNSDIDKLKAKGEASEARLKSEYLKRIEELKSGGDDLKAGLQKLSKAGEDSWEELKVGTERAWKEIKTSLEAAISKFKQKN